MTIAWVFPGQGSQKLGMANSLLELPGSKDRFELASQILGRDLWQICSGEDVSSEEIFDLNDTKNSPDSGTTIKESPSTSSKNPASIASLTIRLPVTLHSP